MKSFLLFISVFAGNYIFAQNSVGIGTTNPQATLDVLRGTAPLGTAIFRGTTNISHFNLGIPEDTYIRGGKSSSHVILNDVGSGKVGIGTYPLFPLSFPGTLGDKISLWNDGSSTHYGMGIQGGLFQIFTKSVVDNIAFGYGSSGAFTETMRIKGNGNVGIGVNDPGLKLDISGRMKIRTGTDGEAGIWLNNTANTNIAAFIGLENDNYVGFYGVAAGWKFSMNTQTGALKINGSEGQAGQVLVSNGGGANGWVDKKEPSFYAFHQTDYQLEMTGLTQSPGEPQGWFLIGGLHNQTITLTKTSTVFMQVRVPIHNGSNAFGGAGSIGLYMGLYDAANAYTEFEMTYVDILDGTFNHAIAFDYKFNLAPGTYRTHLKIRKFGGDNVGTGLYYTGTDNGTLIVQITPQ